MTKINWEKECDFAIEKTLECMEEIRVLKLQDLICKAVKNCNVEKSLRSIVLFSAGMIDAKFIDNGINDMRIEAKKTVEL